jgi:hypothetical protein
MDDPVPSDTRTPLSRQKLVVVLQHPVEQGGSILLAPLRSLKRLNPVRTCLRHAGMLPLPEANQMRRLQIFFAERIASASFPYRFRIAIASHSHRERIRSVSSSVSGKKGLFIHHCTKGAGRISQRIGSADISPIGFANSSPKLVPATERRE